METGYWSDIHAASTQSLDISADQITEIKFWYDS
jgi:hypothetical protein